jgi:hypothetical protein
MNTVIDEVRTRERLTGCIELAHRGATEGEQQAACTAIGRLVLSNPWITTGMVVHTSAPDWRRMIAACCRYQHLLPERDVGFIRSLADFPYISDKQHAVLVRIVGRLRATGVAL